jgi:hypothetical protein
MAASVMADRARIGGAEDTKASMTRSLALGSAIASVLVLLGACSSEPDSPGAPAVSAGASGSAAQTAGSSGASTTAGGGSGGSSAGSTGSDAGSSATGGSTAGAATTGGSAGAGAAGAGGSGGAAGGSPPSGPFSCTTYIGAYLSMEWWNAGFETKVDNDQWQLKWHHHGHITEWRKPDSPFWSDTGDPNDDAQGSPIQSACTMNSTTPDRVVFLAIDWELETEADWIAGLNESIANIKTKYPSAKRVDVMTLVRCPNNMMCNDGANYGPGANDSASLQDCYVPPYVDTAIQKVIDANPTYVAHGPQPEMAMCNPSHDGAHMTGAGNTQAAIDIAAFYNAQP